MTMPQLNNPIHAPGLPPIYYLGPSHAAGPLPAVFYFSLSGEESLSLDPFNQPAIRLSELGVRVFSLTLPDHDGAYPHGHAIGEWVKDVASGGHRINRFVAQCSEALDHLIAKGWADPHKIAVSGLSRGAYIAFLFAARDQRVRAVLGYAPLTHFNMPEDAGEERIIDSPLSSLNNFADALSGKIVKVYIGNNDTRVSTASCFSFIEALTHSSVKHKHRPPPIEMVIYPSIGHKGHGTPPQIFNDGADWLAAIV